ncbi:hypothetical protein CC86DRAFT_346064 [Ophiobolus disseminans]|uniref:Uncharacterized protein n=1 Tax=Ophiobolus disseminans TaxID=1469910 RepID=A0A6A7A849_9PLEO|nr:hypothetical protein CC86DRAFT_346064 [Ophiobolus disseminans]
MLSPFISPGTRRVRKCSCLRKMEYSSAEEEEEEPSALDYARQHALCKPYYNEQPLAGNLPTPPRDDFDQDPWDESTTNTIHTLTKERLTVNKDAVLLLKTVHEFRDEPSSEILIPPPRRCARELKQELPVLRTDNELDMLSFGCTDMPDLTQLRIPFEVVNVENDEGFDWPAKYFSYPTQCEAQIKAEKLAVSRNVLVYLQEAIRDSYAPGDLEKLREEQLGYKPADSLTRNGSDSSDSMLLDVTHPPQLSPLFEKRTPMILKRRAEELKVEGPLTPPMFSPSPLKKLKSVSFSDILHQFIPEAPWVKADSEDGHRGSNSYFDEAFNSIQPLAREAIRRIGNEQLSGADTTARVDIPQIDFTLPVTPWNEYSQRKGGKHRPDDTELGAQKKFLLRVKREDLKTATSWHGVSSLERGLKWNIFTTKISKINLEEQLHGETEFNKVITDLTTGNIATSSAQVWKPDGLRILQGEDEEEIEAAEMEERTDMEALIRKRRLEIEEEAPEVPRRRTPPGPALQVHFGPPQVIHGSHHWNGGVSNPQKPAKTRFKTSEYQDQKPQAAVARHKSLQTPKETTNDLMFGGFSATSALYKFMETRGKTVEVVSAKAAEKDRLTKECRRQETTILTQLYSAAEIVYRDYSLPHSPTKEADILLSPSTGLILTTLQQIKQSPLPGQPDRSLVKERIRDLQMRYERLVVVISQGLSREMESQVSGRPDDPRDKDALARFEGFASQMEGEVLVKYIRGGEQALAHSIVVEMGTYGLQHGSTDIGTTKPLAVETTWEVFLRRAGLNPFAAQVIVASLQKSIDVQIPPDSSSPLVKGHAQVVPVSGLPAFLMMDKEERVRRFQALMGGSRILNRVSKALDQGWVSAAHGFRM